MIPTSRRRDLVLAVVGAGLGLAAGLAFAWSPAVGAVLVGGALVLSIVVTRPIAPALFAVAGVWAVYRVGGAQGPLSYSDLLLAAAAAIALASLVGGPELGRLRPALVGLGVYLACLLPTVLLDDSSRGWLEWAHRLVLVGGSLVVGAWIAREDKVRTALRILVAVSCLVALLAVLYSVRNGFEPAYPVGLHKNFVGSLLKIVLILVVLAPKRLGVGLPVRLLLIVVISSGLLAAQSRGALLAAAAGILFAVALSPRGQGRSARGVIILLTTVLVGVAFFSVRSDFEESPDDFANNSIGARQQVEERAREIWRTSPVIGVGLKYFNSGEWGPLAQPANVVVDNELAESGVLGLAGFVVLQVGLVGAAVRRRREDPFLAVAAGCVTASLAHGMVDIYWTAGSATLPLLVLGMALGGRPSGQPPPGAGKRRASARASTWSQPRDDTAAGAAAPTR